MELQHSDSLAMVPSSSPSSSSSSSCRNSSCPASSISSSSSFFLQELVPCLGQLSKKIRSRARSSASSWVCTTWVCTSSLLLLVLVLLVLVLLTSISVASLENVSANLTMTIAATSSSSQNKGRVFPHLTSSSQNIGRVFPHSTSSSQNIGRVFPHSTGMKRRRMMQAAAAAASVNPVSIASVNPVSVNQQIQQAVFKGYYRNKTGIPFSVTMLPPELSSDITVQAVRLRTGKLRSKGFVFNEFRFPIGFVAGNSSIVRVILVYQKFSSNNNFSVYSPPAGQVFSSPVLGMMVYDASNLNDTTSPQPPLNMSSASKPIVIKFPANMLTTRASLGSLLLLCASYATTGAATVSNVDPGTEGQCSFTQVGTFALLEPAPGLPVPSSSSQSSMTATAGHPQHHYRHLKALKIALGMVFGSVALAAVLLVSAVGLWKYQQKRHFARMQYQSDQGETLQNSLIGNSRAPAAGSTRTRPTLETLN